MAFHMRNTDKVSILNDEEELRKRGYVIGSLLGEGSYAKVKSAHCERLNKKVALKIINKHKAPKDFLLKFLPREIELMQVIHHPNIVQLHEVMQLNGKVYIAMEMAGHGDLLEYIKLRGAIPEEKAKCMFQQMLNAVEYLHNIDIVHRDLKCENILLDANNTLKVSDFGFARLLKSSELSKTFCGSAAYAAPEILQGIPYSGPPYDIWSMGVILYIMLCGSMPFDDSNIKKMIKYQTEKKVGFSRSHKFSDEAKNLIHRMLECVVSARATSAQIQDHVWLQNTKSRRPSCDPTPCESSPSRADDKQPMIRGNEGMKAA